MLPNPESYADWKDYARALNKAMDEAGLGDLIAPVQTAASGGGGGGGPATSITMPDGYKMVWLSQADAELFLGNSQFDPPQAADLFQIDTGNIANAAIETAKLADLSVSIDKLLDGAVGELKLADLAVSTAKMRDAAIVNAKIANATILGAKIADATIVSALIGEAQIVEAKIADLAVNSAKIANAAITSAKIANLSVGSAHIIDGQIINAKIGNLIQSYGWNDTTKDGWRITKDGSIEGRNITIYNADGSIAFASGSKVNLATQVIGALALGSENLTGFGALAGQNSVDRSQTTGFGALAALSSLANGSPLLTGFGALSSANAVDLATQVYNALPNFNYVNGSIDRSRTSGFGTLAALSLLTAGNIGTYIEGAAISRALIALAAIGTANIDNAAITTALIADAAISNVKIADAAITNAKIANLSFDKMTAGTLNARIDMGSGTIVFTVGGSQLILGRGFGTNNQFFLWFGPTQASMANCSEVNGTVWMNTAGSAYFGGVFLAGQLRSGVQNPSAAANVTADTGNISSNGGEIQIVASWSYSRTQNFGSARYPATLDGRNTFEADAAAYNATDNGSGSYRGSRTLSGLGVQLSVAKNGVVLDTITINTATQTFDGIAPIPGDSPGSATILTQTGDSFTRTDTERSTATRSFQAILSRGGGLDNPTVQRTGISTVEV
jgi:hypothetical protein